MATPSARSARGAQVLLVRRRGLLDQYAGYTRIFERLKRSRVKPVLRWGFYRVRSVKRALRRG